MLAVTWLPVPLSVVARFPALVECFRAFGTGTIFSLTSDWLTYFVGCDPFLDSCLF